MLRQSNDHRYAYNEPGYEAKLLHVSIRCQARHVRLSLLIFLRYCYYDPRTEKTLLVSGHHYGCDNICFPPYFELTRETVTLYQSYESKLSQSHTQTYNSTSQYETMVIHYIIKEHYASLYNSLSDNKHIIYCLTNMENNFINN